MFFFLEEVDYETNYYKMLICNKQVSTTANDVLTVASWVSIFIWFLGTWKPNPDPEELNVPPVTKNDNYPIVREESEEAEKSLKKGKSVGLDNIPEGDGLGKRKCRD